MLHITLDKKPQRKAHDKVDEFIHFDLRGKSKSEKVKLLILRDLWNVNWTIEFRRNKIIVEPPSDYNKDIVKRAMSMKRLEVLHNNKRWIKNHIAIARENLASGDEVLSSPIRPVIEICESQKQLDLFRILRYYWSSPYSDYVGRRIKLLIRDEGLPCKPIIGIAALGSPIIHIPERDNWIGWDKETRTSNLIYTMDAYVVGALPPYNYLLGGKLISYILASKEIRDIYRAKYKNRLTIIDKRVSDKLIGIFTTSLYGRSSQYNRLKYNENLLYIPIGQTKGFGTLHLSQQTIDAMTNLIKSQGMEIGNCFGNGPSWIMRTIRAAGDILGFDSDYLLRHSFKREIYFTPLAKNYKDVLNGKSRKPNYTNFKMDDLVEHWRQRWLLKRRLRPDVLMKMLEFSPNSFDIEF